MEIKSQMNDLVEEEINCINRYIYDSVKGELWEIRDVYPYMLEKIAHVRMMQLNTDIKDSLGTLYENTILEKDKRDKGQFYTKERHLLQSVIASVDVLAGKILEPSCGTGCILVEVVKKIIVELKAAGYKAKNIIHYIAENVYANDCDRVAASITEINLLKVMLPLVIEARNEDVDYVMPRLKIYHYDFIQKGVFHEEFSLIIGNPPFVTMYGKRSRNMTEEKRKYFNTFDFVQNKNGNNKFNLSMFFLENGLKLLKHEGCLCYILDIAFFETAFVDMRKYIVENYYIDVLMIGLQEFENVASGQLVINIINKKESNSQVKMIDYTSKKTKLINQCLWNNEKNRYKYAVPLNGMEKSIDDKLKKFNLLSEYFPKKSLRTCCALTGKTEKFIINPNEEYEGMIFPYIEGAKGLTGKFCIPTPHRYIKYDYDLQLKLSEEFKIQLKKLGVKNKKRVTLGDKEAYLAPKIFIRQSATEIIATYCTEPFAANNSIYILTTKRDDEQSIKMLKYTCGLLNSELITFFCRINGIIRAEKGKVPQIKISDLKNIRINVDEKYFEEVVVLVDKLLMNPDDQKAYKELNDMVYRIYSITKQEMQFIKKYLLK